MNKKFRRGVLTKVEERSLTCKRNLFISNLLSFGLAGYSFVRHNNFCEPYGKPFLIIVCLNEII